MAASDGAGPSAPQPRKSLMRSLGEFVGHIWRGATAPVEGDKRPDDAARSQRLRVEIEQEQRSSPQGPVVLRRTTIEEIELPSGEGRGQAGAAEADEAQG